ncbi:MAG: nucleotidyltransferase domain-containing protein [Nanoarchaeota archaeon]|nr:nucleotidyltransferase domain-containing protein [Nanoarchaeota archaeon]
MLKLFYNLKPFFEDCYRRISVREYARLIQVTPPTASNILKKYHQENLLHQKKDRGYLFFYANKSKEFIDLSRIYWNKRLADLLSFLEKEIVHPTIILFGSLSKAEVKKDSDIDLAIISTSTKKLNLNKFEKTLSRNIQIFLYRSFQDIKNKELKNNLLNGYILKGKIKLS